MGLVGDGRERESDAASGQENSGRGERRGRTQEEGGEIWGAEQKM
jgi:hypothetical protein